MVPRGSKDAAEAKREQRSDIVGGLSCGPQGPLGRVARPPTVPSMGGQFSGTNSFFTRTFRRISRDCGVRASSRRKRKCIGDQGLELLTRHDVLLLLHQKGRNRGQIALVIWGPGSREAPCAQSWGNSSMLQVCFRMARR